MHDVDLLGHVCEKEPVGCGPEHVALQPPAPFDSKPPLQEKPQAPFTQDLVLFAGVGQLTPQAPQLLRSAFVFTQTPLQSVKPALQTTPQAPPAHTALPFVGVGQPVPQAPQLATSELMLISQPSPATPLQLA